MKLKNINDAVSEVLGTILLLGMAVSVFTILSVVVLSYPFDPSPPTVHLMSYIDENNIIIEHRGGENLHLETEITIKINDSIVFETTAGEKISENTTNEDNYWNIGEFVEINATNPPISEIIADATIYVTVVDPISDIIILMGYIQEAD